MKLWRGFSFRTIQQTLLPWYRIAPPLAAVTNRAFFKDGTRAQARIEVAVHF